MKIADTLSMVFTYRLIETLPRLAWCARFTAGEPCVDIWHGPWVEVREEWFAEGAWAGSFADGQFHRAHALMGSGVRLENGGVVIATATHFHESVYSMRVGSELFISNSKVFVLAQAGDDLDPEYPFYAHDLAMFRSQGLRRTVRALPTRDGHALEQHSFVNVRIGRDLCLNFEEKPVAPEPETFAAYRDQLDETTSALVSNAQDGARLRRYRMKAMVSRGYDSPASATFAARCGCREAITFAKLDADDDYQDDGGTAIAECLGMQCAEFSRTAFKRISGAPDAEFCACPNGGHVQLAAIEDQLSGVLLFQGHHGDVAWSTKRSSHCPNLCRHVRQSWLTLADCSESEFRIRVGFINYSAAYVGAQHSCRLREIALSEEMRSWSVGGGYDRPIPRRLVEEAGVPRTLFGQKKISGLNHMYTRLGLTPTGESAFARYSSTIRLPSSFWQRHAGGVHRLAYGLNSGVVRMLNRIGDRFEWKTVLAPGMHKRHEAPITKYHFVMQWGVTTILDRYRVDERDQHLAARELVA